ncbi:hypothetical protein, partial [Pseudomonas mandelii]|uniref:hypothetical protein n=1 Tax=Pseudomonas mandelii TaxID=75612 RepID=UPI003D00A217
LVLVLGVFKVISSQSTVNRNQGLQQWTERLCRVFFCPKESGDRADAFASRLAPELDRRRTEDPL